MPLDSDAPNADAQLHVEFYEHDREPNKGVPFVRIMIPGDKTNIYDQPARDHHRQRFPRQWLYYQMKNSDASVVGTPLLVWHRERPDEFSVGQMEELNILKFQTVEQLATASDAQIQRVGMGAAGLRERARSFITAKNAQTSGAELANAQAEIAALRALVEGLAANATAAKEAAPVKSRGRRGGWNKGKKRVPVNVNHDNAAIDAAGEQ